MADFNVAVPTFRPNATTEEKLESLMQYSRKINEQLRFVLNNLEMDNFTLTASQQLASAASVSSTVNSNNAETQQAIKDIKYNAAQIISNIQSIQTELTNATTWISSEGATVEQLETTKYELDGSKMSLTQVREEVAKGLNDIFGNSEDGTYREKYYGYIAAGQVELDDGSTTTGITISTKSGAGNFETIYTSSRLEFRQNGNLLAYFSNNEMYIPTINTSRIRFGQLGDAFYWDAVGTDLFLRYGQQGV